MPHYEIGHLRPTEIENLLALQKENLRQNLDPQTIETQGFVSFQYTSELLKDMMADEPQIIARDGDKVVGYALVSTLRVSRTIGQMIPMLDIIETLNINNKPVVEQKYYLIGQVCVRVGYRGIGIIDALYEGHKQAFSEKYDFAITEIADDNKRSLAAHNRVGFQTVHVFFDELNAKNWHVVALPYTQMVV